ncbi:hypothetical protein QR680_011089 [Steinernema hermaphroditum]|uniref:RING-type domain-containing protein n=1 Tax=Steinernema hermaphroditum TaxID=289476 RepID=A0AA39IR49_9BILA|nr:hypothetical protein QR680_011089 [Steinernema hermaphroditum]
MFGKLMKKSSKEEQTSPTCEHQHLPERSLSVRKLKCPMCSESLCSRTFVQLPCHHYFHMHCVPWWKGDCSFCPICQEPVDHVEWIQA